MPAGRHGMQPPACAFPPLRPRAEHPCLLLYFSFIADVTCEQALGCELCNSLAGDDHVQRPRHTCPPAWASLPLRTRAETSASTPATTNPRSLPPARWCCRCEVVTQANALQLYETKTRPAVTMYSGALAAPTESWYACEHFCCDLAEHPCLLLLLVYIEVVPPL